MWRFHTGKEVPTYVFDDRQAKDRRVQTGWALQSTSMPRMWRWENDRYSPLCYLQHIKNDSSAFLNSDGGVLLTGILDNGECLSVRSPCRDYRLAVNRTIKRTKRIWLNWPTRPGSKMRLYSNLLKVRGSQRGAKTWRLYILFSPHSGCGHSRRMNLGGRWKPTAISRNFCSNVVADDTFLSSIQTTAPLKCVGFRYFFHSLNNCIESFFFIRVLYFCHRQTLPQPICQSIPADTRMVPEAWGSGTDGGF